MAELRDSTSSQFDSAVTILMAMAYQELTKGYYPTRIVSSCLTVGLSSFYWGYYLGVLAEIRKHSLSSALMSLEIPSEPK
jgi:hypothetical protein